MTRRVQGLVALEVEIGAGEDLREGFRRRLDAFREAVLPGQEHGVHIHTQAPGLPAVAELDDQGQRMGRLVVLGEPEVRALDTVLDYSIPDEAQDFREQFEFEPDPEREDQHILAGLTTLSNAVTGEQAIPRLMAGLPEAAQPRMEGAAIWRGSIPER